MSNLKTTYINKCSHVNTIWIRGMIERCLLQEVMQKIQQTAAETVDDARPQCFVLFVLSHGKVVNNEEVVFGTDGNRLLKKLIRDELSDTRCPNLKGVPRLVFFQCCRGGTAQIVFAVVTFIHVTVCVAECIEH